MLRGATSIGTSGGGIGLKSAGVLAQSAVPASVTGTLTPTALASVVIPAGAMGINGQARVTTFWSYTNSANNKTLQVQFGGVAFLNQIQTTTAGNQQQTIIRNRGVANSQVGFGAGAGTAFASTTATAVNSAIDTTAPVTLSFVATLANTGETITLESYTVEILNP